MLTTEGFAQPELTDDSKPSELVQVDNTLQALESFIKLSADQKELVEQQQALIHGEDSITEKARKQEKLERLQEELRATNSHFREVAAGTDISILQAGENQTEFDIQEEVLALLKPVFEEMRELTADARQKTALNEKIAFYQERIPVIQSAIENISTLQKSNAGDTLSSALNDSIKNWQQKQTFMQSELQAAEVQLNKILAAESSLTESYQGFFKSFFKKRGAYLLKALLVIILVVLVSRYSHRWMLRNLPGFQVKHRSFRVRLADLIHRFATFLFIVMGPMAVFYLEGDWLFFSMGILILFGLVWTLARALPHIWREAQLFLNVGAVREGERIHFNGLPWRVERINLYCDLSNPVANIRMRVPIDDLINAKSRPFDPNEPWFPCKKDDWVILSDGVRGKVIGISPEMVQLVQRGGAQITYRTDDFLGKRPMNLATNFRLKEIIGISYNLQNNATTTIPQILKEYIQQRAAQDGYGEDMLNLQVELEKANDSSLDIVVIADFKGEQGGLYNRLRRAIQRWCVDACTENNWEIPFPQMSMHQGRKQ